MDSNPISTNSITSTKKGWRDTFLVLLLFTKYIILDIGTRIETLLELKCTKNNELIIIVIFLELSIITKLSQSNN